MKFSFSAKNFEYTDQLKETITKKLGRLEKFFKSDAEVHVFVKGQRRGQIVEVTVQSGSLILRAEEVQPEVLTSIDKINNILERQVRKYKTRLEKRLREGAYINSNFEEPQNIPEEGEFEIIRTKKIQKKPMTVEEAILQMNLLGHEFFVFHDMDGKINVVYKRKDSGYGLIEA